MLIGNSHRLSPLACRTVICYPGQLHVALQHLNLYAYNAVTQHDSCAVPRLVNSYSFLAGFPAYIYLVNGA
jgi:hypothetical protein